LLLFNLDDIFTDTKKRTAWRARFAKDEKGKPIVDKLVLTDDDRDMFDDLIKKISAEAFRKASAWAKGIAGAYRHNVKFGDPQASGSILSGITASLITNPAQVLTTNELAGMKLVITSPGLSMNQERTIVSNTADTIVVDSAFAADVTGLEFAVMTQTDDFIIFYLDMETTWDLNQLMAATEAIREALVTGFVKEWYLYNRYMDDAGIEALAYAESLEKIKSLLSQRNTPYRRSGEIFS
jgi:hypothetical protein